MRLLSFMLPFGVLATPFVGRTIDALGPWPSLVVTNWVGILQGALSVALPLEAMPLAFVVYVAYRAVLYGTFCAVRPFAWPLCLSVCLVCPGFHV